MDTNCANLVQFFFILMIRILSICAYLLKVSFGSGLGLDLILVLDGWIRTAAWRLVACLAFAHSHFLTEKCS